MSTQLIADLREAVVPSNARMGGGVNECHSVASLFHAYSISMCLVSDMLGSWFCGSLDSFISWLPDSLAPGP